MAKSHIPAETLRKENVPKIYSGPLWVYINQLLFESQLKDSYRRVLA